MQGMANEIVDQDRAAAYAQRLAGKVRQFGGLQVMSEQAATDEIKTIVMEGKCECVGYYGTISAQQVSAYAIEVGDIQRNSQALQLVASGLRHFSKSSGRLQHGEVLGAGCGRNAFNQLSSGCNSAEPAVDAAQIA